jgi:hypothetical protein
VDQWVPAIYGDNVVWHDARSGNDDVYIVTVPGMVSGSVALEDTLPANLSTQMTFELRQPGTTTIIANAFPDEDPNKPGTQVTTAPNTGAYTLKVVPVGTYDIGVKGSKWLRKVLTNVAVQSWVTTTATAVLLYGGDANDSNTVNIQDLNILKATYGKSKGQPGYDDRANFNNDNSVNIVDLTILQRHYGESGDP